MKHKRILFAVSLGESGINLEFYPILKKIRMERNCFEGSVGGIIVDGQSELFTKSVGRELVFSANLSGCSFRGSRWSKVPGRCKTTIQQPQEWMLIIFKLTCIPGKY